MINAMIPMWTTAETRAFGYAMIAFVLSTVFLYLTISAMTRLRAKESKPRERKRCEVDRDEFNRIGYEALRQQKMQSFIAETDLGEVEVIKE